MYMKKVKKGFTLIEIIACIVLLAIIAGVFAVNFIKTLDKTNSEEYKNNVKNIEVAADAYVGTYKDSSDSTFEDIRIVVNSEESFCYIPVAELEEKGFLNGDLKNPDTGEKFNGVVKFTKEEGGNYKFEYIDGATDYITVVYNKNGATTVTRTAQAFICEKITSMSDIADCVRNATLPSVTRVGGTVLGWSLNSEDTSSKYSESTSLANLIKNGAYSVKNNILNVYAISKDEKTVSFNENTAFSIDETHTSCTVYNSNNECSLTLPSFTAPNHYYEVGWNTNMNGTGDTYEIGKTMKVTNDMTLYATTEIEDFDILVNKLNRVEDTTVTPANINIVFVLDVSGSMSSNSRMSNLIKVCKGLVERMNLGNSTVSLIKFASNASTLLTMSQDKSQIVSSINSLRASGGTSFTSAISKADQLVQGINNGKETYVIFVSDGISSISSTNSSLLSLKSKTKIYTMGIGATANNQYLQSIASELKNYYSYNDSGDDLTLSGFYDLFDDIVQDIIVLEGDGLANAVSTKVSKGKLDLGYLVLTQKYPFEIYLNNTLVDSYTTVNDYFYNDNGTYYFDVLNYSLSKSEIGIDNMTALRIRFFYKVNE